jgi:lipopolysaccharide/colanic/teichoic acid biosynthesis glycosyltransferase
MLRSGEIAMISPVASFGDEVSNQLDEPESRERLPKSQADRSAFQSAVRINPYEASGSLVFAGSAERSSAIPEDMTARVAAVPEAKIESTKFESYTKEETSEQLQMSDDPATIAAAQRLRTGRLGYRFVKRLCDIVFSALFLVLFCWLYLIIAIAIKVDDPSGPVIFKQRRVGRDGKEFMIYKFRSMCVDAEDKLQDLEGLNEKTGPVFKMADDPRLTRVGRVIRKMSLDELPQFVNVIKGDLSIVGPRPALPREVAEYTPYQRQRLLCKQGLTCYWQTRRDRDSITFDKWVELDLLYIRQCGVWTDFKLIIQTVGTMLMAQGH